MNCKKDNSSNIKKADVIVKKDSTSRAYWKLAVVEEPIRSANGYVRAAIVNAARESKNTVLLRRAIQH